MKKLDTLQKKSMWISIQKNEKKKWNVWNVLKRNTFHKKNSVLSYGKSVIFMWNFPVCVNNLNGILLWVIQKITPKKKKFISCIDISWFIVNSIDLYGLLMSWMYIVHISNIMTFMDISLLWNLMIYRFIAYFSLIMFVIL